VFETNPGYEGYAEAEIEYPFEWDGENHEEWREHEKYYDQPV